MIAAAAAAVIYRKCEPRGSVASCGPLGEERGSLVMPALRTVF